MNLKPFRVHFVLKAGTSQINSRGLLKSRGTINSPSVRGGKDHSSGDEGNSFGKLLATRCARQQGCMWTMYAKARAVQRQGCTLHALCLGSGFRGTGFLR